MVLDLDMLVEACAKKHRYRSLEAAGRAADKAKNERGVELRAYPCPCGGFHLTKMLEPPRISEPPKPVKSDNCAGCGVAFQDRRFPLLGKDYHRKCRAKVLEALPKERRDVVTTAWNAEVQQTPAPVEAKERPFVPAVIVGRVKL